MVQTVVKEQYESETVTFGNSLTESDYAFTVYGQTVDRSYEDRDVFFSFATRGWLRGEDAIALGQLLIKHGARALNANMINHQLIHNQNEMNRFLQEGRVAKVTLAVVDEKPANHGSEFRTFLIQPTWHEGKAPEYEEDFAYERVIYFSPFDEEFSKQVARFGENVEFVGYDHEAAVAAFKEFCKQQEDGSDMPVVDVAGE
jgi:hypothetical protein